MSIITLEKEQNLAVIWMDYPDEKINKISPELVEEFTPVLDEFEKDASIEAGILISRKPDNFIAGADLELFLRIVEPGVAGKFSREGKQLLNRMAGLSKPIIAAIHGPALGGGLEVALACHYRICTDDPKTVLALPEVRLGLLPGAGGTQRLPRLIGIQRSLDMMLTGKNVYPRQAKRMGLVDQTIHKYGLQEAARLAARKLIGQPIRRKDRRSLPEKFLEATAAGRKLIYKKAREMVQKQTQGNYPAPFKIIQCVETGMEKGFQAGEEIETQLFDELVRSPEAKNLIRLFFNMNSRKKNPLKEHAREVKKIGILGAGLMGSGIAQVSAADDLNVLIKDINFEAIGKALKSIWADLDRRVRRRAMNAFQRDQILSRITGVTDYKGFGTVDVVIEAVFEDLALKQKVLEEIESVTRPDCIFASNTSSIPISSIAANSKRPELVLGMHYFSPVPKMPLLEIIVTPKTEQWVTATAIDVGIRQGKSVIVVNDGPGFYTTRILAPMLNEALLILEEGGIIEEIDRAMRQFGFPIGPVALIDEVGIDVGAHVTKVLAELFEQRGVQATDAMQKLVEAGYRGKKNKQGFYLYNAQKKTLPVFGKKKRKEANREIYRFFGGGSRKHFPAAEIQDRLSLVMLNEAAYCLQEGILKSPEDGDLGAILGLGFPPFRGGPFRYMDTLGTSVVVERLGVYNQKLGVRFTPANILVDMAEKGSTFYET